MVSHPTIAEAAVVSKAHKVKGESIVVFARVKEGITPSPALKKEIVETMRKMIGPIALPDEIYFVTKLPKTRSGKIVRRILKAVANGTLIGDVTTLEDESAIEEVVKTYEELAKAGSEAGK